MTKRMIHKSGKMERKRFEVLYLQEEKENFLEDYEK